MKDIQIADNIIFSEEIHGVVIDGQKVRLSNELYGFLECLVRAKGGFVSPTYFINEVLDISSDVDNTEGLIKDTVKRLRKILGDTEREKTVIVNKRDVGYYLAQYKEIGHSGEFPVMLTKTAVPNVSSETVLFRDKDVERVIQQLNGNVKTIALHGFGGVGKTSVARLVYSKIKSNYDSFGWLDYHSNLKTSMVECFDWDNPFFTRQNEATTVDEKWRYLSGLIKNSKQKKLLVIDNVDIDHEIGQDPGSDYPLMEISGWINTDIIITTRLPELKGYYPIEVKSLGDDHDDNNCVKLFCHYAGLDAEQHAENYSEVRNIVRMAGYNTMVIELLAKSSIYEESLSRYSEKLKKAGFGDLSLPVMTMHNAGAEVAVEQIRRLFSIRRRSDIEKTILTSFILLSEGEKISRGELETWLGYKLRDIDQLVKEGWISFRGGFFSIHPLIRQAITLSEELIKQHQGQIQQIVMNEGNESLYSGLMMQTLFDDGESFGLNLRKLSIVDRLTYPYDCLEVSILIYMGDYARKIGRRDLAVKYYKNVCIRVKDETSHMLNQNLSGEMEYEDMLNCWKAVFYYGYMLSYTMSGMAHAEEIVRKAVRIAEVIDHYGHTDETKSILAKSRDHLGYIVSHSCEGKKERYLEARKLLEECVQIRASLCENYPESKEYLHDLAWSKDNMGFLLANADERYFDEGRTDKEALRNELITGKFCLMEALNIRESMSETIQDRQTLSEVAWSLCNLGICLSALGNNTESNATFLRAIEIYEDLEMRFPGFEKASLARVLSAYAKTLVTTEEERGLKMLYKALELNTQLENETPGIYTREIEHIQDEIRKIQHSVQ